MLNAILKLLAAIIAAPFALVALLILFIVFGSGCAAVGDYYESRTPFAVCERAGLKDEALAACVVQVQEQRRIESNRRARDCAHYGRCL